MRSPALPLKRLLIVSHVVHYRSAGRIHAYGPYAREVEIWADLFPEVVIACPVREGSPPGDALPMHADNIVLWPLKETGGEHLADKIRQLFWVPGLVLSLARAIWAADAVHVRCPGNVGLLGVALTPLFGRPRIAKFAGQWNGYNGEPWTGRLQRWLLRRWWQAPVTVYGEWPNQPPHVIPFFTSMMSRDQVARAVRVAESRVLGSPLRVLFSGRLAPEKRASILLEAVRLALDRGARLEVAILGDGPERGSLERDAARLGIEGRVRFLGALPFDQALGLYEWAHCLVLPSVHSEGWPKVLAEAMCHGVICVAVNHGQIPAMLTGRGVVLERGSAEEIADALERIAGNPTGFSSTTLAASQWARAHSLEALRSALARLLSQQWNVTVSALE